LIVRIHSNYTLYSRISLKLGDRTIAFYIFYTAGDASINGTEWAGFLSSQSGCFKGREGNIQSKPGRPILRHTKKSPYYRHSSQFDGSIITAKQMKDQLGFEVETLFTSSLKIDARDVEDALQLKYQDLPLGCRLWRRPDAGAKYEELDGKVHSVGIVYSYQIAPLIEQDWIRVDGTGGHKKLRANLNVSSPPVVGKKETAKKS
jgi:hypothetical protein